MKEIARCGLVQSNADFNREVAQLFAAVSATAGSRATSHGFSLGRDYVGDRIETEVAEALQQNRRARVDPDSGVMT